MIKVCPVVTRSWGLDILMFRHPEAGVQLVKGTVIPGETIFTATARELREESGLRAGYMERLTDSVLDGILWKFTLCRVPDQPDTWLWKTQDDHGHLFAFFWHQIDDPAPRDCAPIYQDALAIIAAAIRHKDVQ